MLIGLDFDNTIVCYDRAIEILANDLLDLPPNLPRTKIELRDFLRAEGREDEWTTFQAHLYGPGLAQAEPFPGSVATIVALQAAGHTTVIISHKTQHPYMGPQFDLHAAAHAWINHHMIFEDMPLFCSETVFLNETKQEKLVQIERLACDIFLDDLPEILTDSGFPRVTRPVLFSSSARASDAETTVRSWREFKDLCLA